MRTIRKLRIFKEKFTPLVVAGTMMLSLSSCGSVDMSELTTEDLLAIESVADITELDELIENAMLKSNIVEETDKLERYMNIVDSLSEINFEGVDELIPLSEEDKEKAQSLTDSEIEELIEKANSKPKDLKGTEQRIIALKKLHYLMEYCNKWIIEKGKQISIDFMIAAGKASVANELGISINDYNKITIPPLIGSVKDEIPTYCIIYEDERYFVSSNESEIWDTLGYIYTLQSADKLTDKTRFATYRKAINYGKTTIAAGCDIQGNEVVKQNNYNYIKENYIPKK